MTDRPSAETIAAEVTAAIGIGVLGQATGAPDSHLVDAYKALHHLIPDDADELEAAHLSFVIAGTIASSILHYAEPDTVRVELVEVLDDGSEVDVGGPVPDELGLAAAFLPAIANRHYDEAAEAFTAAGPRSALRAGLLLYRIAVGLATPPT